MNLLVCSNAINVKIASKSDDVAELIIDLTVGAYAKQVREETFVQCKEAFCADNFDKAVERILIQCLTRLVVRPGKNCVENVL